MSYRLRYTAMLWNPALNVFGSKHPPTFTATGNRIAAETRELFNSKLLPWNYSQPARTEREIGPHNQL